jgi:transposase
MARVEIFSGRERRRFWSDAQKLAILDEIASSDLGVVAVARRHDVSPQQVYGWRRHFRKALAKPTPSLVPVTLVDAVVPEARSFEAAGVARASRVEIRCLNGRILIVETGFDAAELKALIRSVEDA